MNAMLQFVSPYVKEKLASTLKMFGDLQVLLPSSRENDRLSPSHFLMLTSTLPLLVAQIPRELNSSCD